MISVLISTYNRASLLRKLLNSFLEIVLPEKIEFIVVDNNSKDNTRKVVKEFYCENPSFNLNYIFEEKQGLSYARNAGILRANGEIIAFIDDDAIPDKYWLKGIKDAFEKFYCAGIGGKIIPEWKSKIPSWLDRDNLWRSFRGIIISHDLGNDFREYTLKTPLPIGANMVFKRISFEKYGLFRTDLGRIGTRLCSGEDTEFCERLLLSGEKIIYSPKALVYHPVEEKRLKKSYFIRWHFNTGISSSNLELPEGKFSVLGIPSYKIRDFLNSLVSLLFSLVKNKRKKFFLSQMRLISCLGFFWGKIKRWNL